MRIGAAAGGTVHVRKSALSTTPTAQSRPPLESTRNFGPNIIPETVRRWPNRRYAGYPRRLAKDRPVSSESKVKIINIMEIFVAVFALIVALACVAAIYLTSRRERKQEENS